jgi:pimeloyl-ACP methyl ester carboxylesterase
MAPTAKRAVAYVAAGAFSAAGVAFAVSHEYTKRIRRSAAPEDPELAVPEDVCHRVVPMRDGGESHLIERGDGPPLVLLHGANLSAEVWSYQLRDLAESHRVIALDLRGHGRSSAGS